MGTCPASATRRSLPVCRRTPRGRGAWGRSSLAATRCHAPARRFWAWRAGTGAGECHRRVGRVGPEHRSSPRGRGEQRRPLLRRPQRSERYIVKRLRETHTLFALLDFGTHRTLYALALPLGSRSLVSNPLSRTSESRARRCLLVDRASLYAMSEREKMIKLRVGPSRPDCERDF